MILMNARAPEFHQFVANRFERFEQKFLRAVVTAILRGARAGLQTIRPDDIPARRLPDQQMIANLVKMIRVEAGGERMFKALVEFEVENEKAQCLRRADFLGRAREAQRVRSLVERAGQNPIANGIFDVRFHFRKWCIVSLKNCLKFERGSHRNWNKT